MLIPWQALEEDTLTRLLEEFVSREGTDYGDHIYTLTEKVAHVRRQLDKGLVCIVFDPHSSTSHIITKDALFAGNADNEPDSGA